MARPRKEIDLKKVERLADEFCSYEEIGASVGCSVDTLERNYAEIIKNGHNRARKRLRSAQVALALGRPAQPAVYLRERQNDPDSPLVLDADGQPRLLLAEQPEVKPHATMLIFLGKQYLGQSDKVHFEGEGEGFEFV